MLNDHCAIFDTCTSALQYSCAAWLMWNSSFPWCCILETRLLNLTEFKWKQHSTEFFSHSRTFEKPAVWVTDMKKTEHQKLRCQDLLVFGRSSINTKHYISHNVACFHLNPQPPFVKACAVSKQAVFQTDEYLSPKYVDCSSFVICCSTERSRYGYVCLCGSCTSGFHSQIFPLSAPFSCFKRCCRTKFSSRQIFKIEP